MLDFSDVMNYTGDIMSKAGRPPIEIDKKMFETLCGLQCTLNEFCFSFNRSEDTIERWCKKTYGNNFAEVFAQKRGAGQIALRRNQFRLAEKNAAMAIFLGKNYLGQTDVTKEELDLNQQAFLLKKEEFDLKKKMALGLLQPNNDERIAALMKVFAPEVITGNDLPVDYGGDDDESEIKLL